MKFSKVSKPSILYPYIIMFNILRSIKIAKGVPPYDCTQPLNQSDCGLEPTPVFSYYKPGSRCEIEYWRGCPTFNKFEDQIQCVHHCIFRLLLTHNNDGTEDTEASTTASYEEADEESTSLTSSDDFSTTTPVPDNPCIGTLNISDCGTNATNVYTYTESGVCQMVLWKGCPGLNIFEDQEDCLDLCANKGNQVLKNEYNELEEIEDKLNGLSNDELKEMISFLNEVGAKVKDYDILG